MPVENVRIVVTGTPRADREFQVLMVDKREVARLSAEVAKASGQALKDLEAEIRRNAGLTDLSS